jgi:hypothetical protein
MKSQVNHLGHGLCWALLLFWWMPLAAQFQPATAPSSSVPRLIRYSGIATADQGKHPSGNVGATFALYKDQQGGAALWMETQNVTVDASGHYTLQLGATKPEGLPAELFTSGEARWLGVSINGQAEQARVLLLSVPYALKAADAETIGGLPPSAFMLASPPNSDSSTTSTSTSNSSPNPNAPPLGGSGKPNYLPIWTNSTTLGSSAVFQAGTGAKAKVGINTTTPASALDVKGGGTIRGLFSLPPAGTATATAGFNSQPMDLAASVFNSGTSTAVNQIFQWQAEPVGNDTSNATGSLNLLFAQGSGKQAETGLHIASNGQITFASGQTFPGAGTVTSVGSGLGLKGGPITNSGTLAIDTTVVPQLNVANTFTANQTVNGTVTATTLAGNGASVTNVNASQLGGFASSAFAQLAAANTFTASQTVNGNLSATGVVTGSAFNIGSNLFDYGNLGSQNAFLGFAGNPADSGSDNTAVGVYALAVDTSGSYNTAIGDQAMYCNNGGAYNTATGYFALNCNTTGNDNTASGVRALVDNTTGYNNTASGVQALYDNDVGYNNTASGALALNKNTMGHNNTASGYLSGNTADSSTIIGLNNVAIGSLSAFSTGSLSNATAVGAQAEVGQNNALVLGSINGVNGASANTTVGIGTTTPVFSGLPDNSTTTLNVVGNSTYVPLVVQSPSTFGTWMLLNNTSSGGKKWAILSAASGDGEGAGNLGITNFTGTSTIYLEGNVNVGGNLSKGGGSFKIDHPLDPANKYLYHSFVESPDMMNVYNGNVTTGKQGLATVVLPDYFEALNRDFRYQLTVIGRFAQAIVAKEVKHNRFTIKTSKPGVKVSWQVTGIRQDAYANAHRIQVEEGKPPQEQGRYLHPELFGAPPEQAIGMRSPAPAASAGAKSDSSALLAERKQ